MSTSPVPTRRTSTGTDLKPGSTSNKRYAVRSPERAAYRFGWVHLGAFLAVTANGPLNAGQMRYGLWLPSADPQQESVHRDLLRFWAQTWTVQDVSAPYRHRAGPRPRLNPPSRSVSGPSVGKGDYGADHER